MTSTLPRTKTIDEILAQARRHPVPRTPLSDLRPDHDLIDLRSPGEFARGHIPGARSLPLFDDEERARIGTTYTRVSPEEATDLGLKIILPRLPGLLSRIPHPERTVLYCWRGGMRSALFAGYCRAHGLPLSRLEGGYRAHRKDVRQVLSGPMPDLIVLHGPTGSGKTRLIQTLASTYPTIDLEHLANHRGSAFGHVGLPPQPPQKQFESLLAPPLDPRDRPTPRGGANSRGYPILLEGESPTIGKVSLPPALVEAMAAAPKILLSLPRPVRARLLLEDYAPAIHENPACIERALSYLGSRLKGPRIQALKELLEAQDYLGFTILLLEYHYDPLYERHLRRHRQARNARSIEASDLSEAETRLREVLEIFHGSARAGHG